MLTAIPLFDSPPQPAGPRLDFVACGQGNPGGDPYDQLLARLRQEYVPYSVLLELTHLCNLDCVMCYNVPLDQPELSTDEWLDVLEQLAQAGTLMLTLSGGEILARRDFFTIAERARALGFALDFKTNATLITPKIADRMAALQPMQVDVSLLGATDATFDAVARSKNTLTRVLRGVRLLQERGVWVKLNTLLLDLNVAERKLMLDLAREMGVEYDQVVKVSANDVGKDTAGQLSTHQIAAVMIEYDSSFQRRTPSPEMRTCQVGLSGCLVSPYGEVYPCVELRVSAGNLREVPFAGIWQAPIFRDLRSRHTYGNLPECRICPINAYCEGRCAGLAWKQHGDLYGADLVACQQAQARYQQQHPGEIAPQTPLQARNAAKAALPGFQLQSLRAR